jgi:hypothetical protein
MAKGKKPKKVPAKKVVKKSIAKKSETKRKSPVQYSDDIADEICKMLEVSEFGLRKICEVNHWLPNASTIMKWLAEGTYPYLNERYARARELQAEFMIEKMIEIADDSSNDVITIDLGDGVTVEKENHEFVNRSKLRVETRKWIASKLAPKKYGDKVDVTTGGKELPAAQTVVNLSKKAIKKISEDLENEY